MNKNLIWAIIIVLIVAGGAVILAQNGGEAEVPANQETAQNENEDMEGTTDGEDTEPVYQTPPVSQTVKEFTVSGKNYSFSPSVITVKKGDRVKITYMSTQGLHDFVVDEYGLATKQMQAPGTEVIEFTADKAGSFKYYCSVGSHKLMGMMGILKVE